MPPEVCPHCGAAVPPNAKACPTCGSDEKTGWSDEGIHDGLDLPDDNFDYDEFVREEFANKRTLPRGISLWWWLVSVALLTTLFWLLLR